MGGGSGREWEGKEKRKWEGRKWEGRKWERREEEVGGEGEEVDINSLTSTIPTFFCASS